MARSLDYEGTPIDEELRGKFRTTVESPSRIGSIANKTASKQAKLRKKLLEKHGKDAAL